MRRQERNSDAATSRFVIDTNVIVSALKSLLREEDKASKTGITSLSLLVKLIVDPNLQLFGNPVLIHEYQRLAKQLNSDIITQILSELTAKVEIVNDIPDDALERCLHYFSERDAKDVFHAATCLVTGAILITNDRDFDRIRDAELIKVWSIGDAIRRLY